MRLYLGRRSDNGGPAEAGLASKLTTSSDGAVAIIYINTLLKTKTLFHGDSVRFHLCEQSILPFLKR